MIGSLREYVLLAERADRPDPEVSEEIITAECRDMFPLPVRVFRSALHASEMKWNYSPLIVLWFGGGLVLGSPTMIAPLARSLVKRFNAVVVAPTFRMAPERPFPLPIHDAWDMFKW